MVVLAFLSDPEVVQKILTHLGLPSRRWDSRWRRRTPGLPT